ncbi:N-formylglutamate amidohydrolase [Shinella daejeonensis]|uniref:N-formylglutamate amidohydrolase n=1 Tax=Shinella daejeonensis TaxID=659017 RepID=UPI0020C78AF0|nr:N-formylglutamate amidohydrolase [Shinella daejeonensis]MCP8894552.1 N-formylglutamate amidohydrolase [Shinella daejeonensis]
MTSTKVTTRHDAGRPLLAIDEPPPYAVINPDGASPYLLLCEHASNRIPRALGDLGLPEAERQRHIAWDIGVSALSQHLSRTLDAPLFMTNYSRLVIDCNRPLDVPSAIPEVSETTEIPGNIGLTEAERRQRIDMLFTPYVEAVRRRIDRLQGEGKHPIIIGVHSFTPVYFGKRRPWHAGVLYGRAAAFGRTLIRELEADAALTIGDNEPYTIHPDEDYTVPVHADDRGLPGALIEVRHDLIDTLAGVHEWGERLTRCLAGALKEQSG